MSTSASSSRAMVPMPPAAPSEELRDKIQPQRTRRIQEKLFLKEMEKLADEMCAEALRGHPPVQVSTGDIRKHLGDIQHQIHKALVESTRRMITPGTEMGMSYGQFSNGSGRTGRNHHSDFAVGFRHAQVFPEPSNTQIAHGLGEDEAFDAPVWNPQQVTRLSDRLRHAGPSTQLYASQRNKVTTSDLSLRSLRQQERSTNPDAAPVFVTPIKIGSDSAALKSLDMTMDGNSHCLSARTPRPDPVAEVLAKKVIPLPPLPQASPTVQAILKERSIAEKSKNSSLRSTKPTGPWSARDASRSLASMKARRSFF